MHFGKLRDISFLFSAHCALSFFQSIPCQIHDNGQLLRRGEACPGHGGLGDFVTYKIEQCSIANR